jgi:hypothetical protein
MIGRRPLSCHIVRTEREAITVICVHQLISVCSFQLSLLALSATCPASPRRAVGPGVDFGNLLVRFSTPVILTSPNDSRSEGEWKNPDTPAPPDKGVLTMNHVGRAALGCGS